MNFLKEVNEITLKKKYLTSLDFYNGKVSSDIMYNETRHVVCVFKDFLIFDDFSEYLKRIYSTKECHERLSRTTKFFADSVKSSFLQKQLPSYIGLPESRYLFKNMDKKRKLVEKNLKFQ